MRGEGTVAEVLAGEARFAVVCGDAVEVFRALPDECAHVAYADPPYGLSAQSTADVVACLRAWLAGEVYTHGSVRKGKKHCAAHILRAAIVGDADDAEPESAEKLVAPGVGDGGAAGPVVFSVDLHRCTVFGEEEVDAERAVTSIDNLLVDEGDAKRGETITDTEFALWPRKGFPGCVGACSCASEGEDSFVRVDVWLRHDPPTDSERATGVVALTGAERRAVLALDLRGRTARVLPAEGASDDGRRFLLLPTKHVGALRGARRLSTELQASGASGVRGAADLTLHLDDVVDPPGRVGARAGASDDPGFRGVEQTPARNTVLLHGPVYSRLTNPIKSRGGMMGHEWDAFVPGPEAWREVFRALKPGAYCVAFSSTRTVDLLGIAVRLAGFEMREGMCWVYASGFPKSLDVSKAIDAAEGAKREVVGSKAGLPGYREGETGDNEVYGAGLANGSAKCAITAPATPAAAQWSGYGTATKPAFEPLIVARKPLDGTVAANVQRHGCGALNIDAGRIAAGGPSPSVERRESAARSGWDNRGGSIMDDRTDPARYSAPHAGEQLGRFPASVAIVHSEGCERVGVRKVAGITDGRPGTKASGRLGAFAGLDRRVVQYADADGLETVDEWRCADGCAVAVLGEQSGERTSGSGVKGKRSQVSTYGAPSQDLVTNYNGDSGTAARFFFNAKASSADRLAFVSCTPGCTAHETVIGAREARARSTCPACGGARTKHEHATVKPLDLARYHARLLSLPAHVAPVALVPFCGTGVEARALMEVGFRVIAVDLDARHCAMTRHRLAQPLDAEAPQPRRKATPPPAQPQPVAVAPVATVPAVVPTPPKPQRRVRVAAGQLDLFGDGSR